MCAAQFFELLEDKAEARLDLFIGVEEHLPIPLPF
jgi:hypothetical protein